MSGAFAGERAVVIGLGVAGASAARVLAAEGADVIVSEMRAETALAAELRSEGVEVADGGHAPEHLDGATVVVVSPGVPPGAPVLAWAAERGLPVWGGMELVARLVRAPYLAVTGTNGKTTVTGMLAGCLRAAGIDAVSCGNIGNPFPAAARADHAALVVEVSSFQLAVQSSFHPAVSVLLNLAPDHLDWHRSFGAYRDAKARVFALQGPGDVHVGNRDDEAASALSAEAPCEVRWFTLAEPGPDGAGFVDGRLVAGWSGAELATIRPDTPAMRADAAASATAAHAFGVPDAAIAEGLDAFVPERHRGETVALVDGVSFVDNSKATNPHATLASIGEATGVVLIAGGDAKGVDLAPIATLAPRLAMVVALGTSASEVVALFRGRVPGRVVGSIEEAVAVAFEAATPGGVVLLAPACASWDMFRDYAERGDRFTAAARSLHKEDART
jgi:UDP-N-acetylmuramoylalanine--D-glutamate ligase